MNCKCSAFLRSCLKVFRFNAFSDRPAGKRVEWTHCVCHKGTIRKLSCLSVGISLLGAYAIAQVPADWRKVGSTVIDLHLASLATGPVERVWFSEDGSRLFARTAWKHTYVTSDFEHWQIANEATAPETPTGSVKTLPENSARSKTSATLPTRIYAVGHFAYRSDDGGFTWA